MEKCQCGCGGEVMLGRRFVHGHNQRGCKNVGVIETHSGIPRSKETCLKISSSRKGIVFSEGHKRNISLAKKGKSSPNKKVVVLEKCKCGCGELCSKGRKYRWGHNSTKTKVTTYCKCGCGRIVKTKGKMYTTGHNPSNFNLKRNEKISLSMKQKIKNGEYFPKFHKSENPNGGEKVLDRIVQELKPGEFIFSGNGRIWIEGKCPDWFNINGKKQVIELFGDYWHGEKRTGKTKEQEEEFRKSHFKKYGYDCLVIWASELQNKKLVSEKIKHFVEGN